MKLSKILCVLLILLSFTSCAKLIGTDIKTVVVTISGAEIIPAYNEVRKDGENVRIINHPAVYCVYAFYEGKEYTVYGESFYATYCGRVGESTEATAKIKTYDNGKTKFEIVALKVEGNLPSAA